MITKVNAFLTSVGNIFKTKEEALREEREAVLKKFMLKKTISTNYLTNRNRSGYFDYCSDYETITSFVPDQETINQFLDNYDDIMLKLKEVDKNKDT